MPTVNVDIVIDATGFPTVNPDHINAKPGDDIVYTIQNNDTKPHNVKIPKNDFKAPAGEKIKTPIDQSSVDNGTIHPGQSGTVTLRVCGTDVFGAPNGTKHGGYKYSIHTSSKINDPDLEVNN